MCLLTFNWLAHPEYRLILVGNRDEVFDRPSKPIHQWDSGFFGGKDLKSGGAWMGISPEGRFAAITNYRDFYNLKENPVSRGFLVKNFLEGSMSPFDYLTEISTKMDKYDGFNLLVADTEKMYYLSNYGEDIIEIEPGLHTLSNELLNSDWPKEQLAQEDLQELILLDKLHPTEMLDILKSEEIIPDEKLPDTGVTLIQERALSAQFVRLEDYYGTVNTTAILWGHDGSGLISEKFYVGKEEAENNTITFRTK
ncbi:NRDE family protein [Litoribacter ruber]|uniref:NRDE family protein n=1 Tax=Litoribacter ruber TaxID=702568 RepID=A0AAP2CF67_9BACT|nr:MULTISPECIES: NRDE family protein [Litoribacter]MBS9522565.1 NRDE family protein [Litoribacter alkaliphilus]MBT0811096.1 NRDE family protein [Litoribacter ruber]